MRMTLPVYCLLSLFWSLPYASGHYLWVTIDSRPGDYGAANIYL